MGDSTTTGKRPNRRPVIWGLGVTVLLGVAVGAVALIGGLPRWAHGEAPRVTDETSTPPSETVLTVKTIHPKENAAVQVTVRQQASVEPFFQADLRARVSGVVRAIPKDIGARVRKGELLIDIDVPDLDAEVVQKAGMTEQRRQELSVAEATLQFAEAEREVGVANVKQRKAEVGQFVAVQGSRQKQLARVRLMASRDAVQPERVEEVERDALAADSAVLAAKAAVEKADADLSEKSAGVTAAKADVALKRTMIEVARKDFEKALALAEYARVRAPFDGTIVRRTVDPGSFVQNATTGQSEVLISVARTDLLTVSARFPDNVAPFVTADTHAVIELDDFPDAAISARVTRFSPWIRVSDRTVHVEVDLFNGPQAEYERLAGRTVGTGLAPLSASCPVAVVALNAWGQDVFSGQRKGPGDGLPPTAFAEAPGKPARRLLPGMTAVMRLHLGHFDNPYVVPSSAVYTRGGKHYLLMVSGGKTKQVPVHVHVNDGALAKVSLVERVGDGRGGHREVLRELTGAEEIVASRQIEIGEGRPVTTALSEW